MAAAPEQHAAAHGLGGAHEQGLQASRAVAVSKVRQPDAPATVQTPAAVAPEAPAAPAPAAGGTAGEERHSSFRGVSWHKASERWRASIKIGGKKVSLGSYADEEQAARVFDSEAVRRRGPGTVVNFSLDRYPAELAEWRAAAGVFAPAPARRSVRGLPLRPDYLPMDHVVVAAAVAAVTGTAGAVAAQPVTDSLHPGGTDITAKQEQALAWARARVAVAEAGPGGQQGGTPAGLWQAAGVGAEAHPDAGGASSAGPERANGAAGASGAQANGTTAAAGPSGQRKRGSAALSGAAAAAATAAAELCGMHAEGGPGSAADANADSGGAAEAAGLETAEAASDGPPRKSQYTGVSQKGPGKWIAKIKDKERKIGLGTFGSEEDAARVYDRAAIALRGERAKTNFPHNNYSVLGGPDIEMIMARRKQGRPLKLHTPNPATSCPGLAEAAAAAAAAVSRLQASATAAGPWAQAVASAAGAPAADVPASLWLPPAQPTGAMADSSVLGGAGPGAEAAPLGPPPPLYVTRRAPMATLLRSAAAENWPIHT